MHKLIRVNWSGKVGGLCDYVHIRSWREVENMMGYLRGYHSHHSIPPPPKPRIAVVQVFE